MQKLQRSWSRRSWTRSVTETFSLSWRRQAHGWAPSSRRWCGAIPSPQHPNRCEYRADRMFYWLANFSDTISVLNVFRYITTRTGGAMFTAGVFVFLFGPTIINRVRLRQGKGPPIPPHGPQSHLLSQQGTPTMPRPPLLSSVILPHSHSAHPRHP